MVFSAEKIKSNYNKNTNYFPVSVLKFYNSHSSKPSSADDYLKNAILPEHK